MRSRISLKPTIMAAWRTELQQRLTAAETGQQTARSGTRVDGSHRPANRGERGAVTAQGYLALGLGQRAADLTEQLRLLEEVGTGPRDALVVGALAYLAQDGAPPKWIALLPGGDATWIEAPDQNAITRVQVLSAASPLARQLRECEVGDVEEISLGGAVVEVEILEIL